MQATKDQTADLLADGFLPNRLSATILSQSGKPCMQKEEIGCSMGALIWSCDDQPALGEEVGGPRWILLHVMVLLYARRYRRLAAAKYLIGQTVAERQLSMESYFFVRRISG